MNSNVNIVFARVDNRLVHGQVGMVWSNIAQANLIVVVDDEVAEDAFQQKLMQMTLSGSSLGIRFWSVEKTIKDIWKASDKQKIFIVTKTPQVMNTLIQNDIPIKSVNLGNMHSAPGKKLIAGNYIYADDQDMESINQMKEKGVEVSAQVLPEYDKIIL